MSSFLTCPEKEKITFGSLLRLLHALAVNHYRNQVSFFLAFFYSYCAYRGESEGLIWEPSQGSVSRLFTDKQAPSWYQYNWYMHVNQDNIRNDLMRYLQSVVTTYKQRRLHVEQLEALVASSNNLDPNDREYILSYEEVGEEAALEELLYRTLIVLYNEPYGTAR